MTRLRSARLMCLSASAFLLGCSLWQPEPLPHVMFYAPLGTPFNSIDQSRSHNEVRRLTIEIDELSVPGAAPLSRTVELSELYVQRGLWQRAAGQLEKAIEDFSTAAQLTPDRSDPYFHRWQAYRWSGQRDEAALDHERGMELDPATFSQQYSADSGVI